MAQTKVKLISNGVIVQGNLHASHGITTAHIGEGSNLYYTDARVGSYLSTNSFATESYVGTQISNLVASSPAALDTLNELAAALGDDANFSTTVTDLIALKAPLASPSFTGTITASTSTALTLSLNSTNANGGYLRIMKSGATEFFIGTRDSVSGTSGTGYDIYTIAGNDLRFFTNGTNLALTLDTSQNATFAGTGTFANAVTVTGTYPGLILDNPSNTKFALTNRHTDNRMSFDVTPQGSSTVEVMNLKSTGLGIGVTGPLGKLHVGLPAYTNEDTNSQQAIFGASNGYGVRIGYNETDNKGYINVLKPGVAWGSLILQEDVGKVGIGTTSPNANLQVNRNTSSANLFNFLDVVANFGNQNSNPGNHYPSGIRIYQGSGTMGSGLAALNIGVDTNSATAASVNTATIETPNGMTQGLRLSTRDSSAPIRFNTDSTERMRIDSSGNVGIGTDSPSVPLTVQSNSAGIASRFLGRSSDGYAFLTFRNQADTVTNGEIGINDAKNMLIYTGNTPKMTILSGGYVGIGTTNPTSLLTVNDGNIKIIKSMLSGGTDFDFLQLSFNGGWSGNVGGLAAINFTDSITASNTVGRIGVTYTGSQGKFVITDLYSGGYSASGDVFTIQADGQTYIKGKVGIGTTSLAGTRSKLGVSFNVTGSAANLAESVTYATMELYPYRNGSTYGMFFGNKGTTSGYIQTANNAGNGAGAIVINPFGGNVGIGTDNIAPTSTLDVRKGRIALTGLIAGTGGHYIALSGQLPGYSTDRYNCLETNLNDMHFAAGGVYTGYISYNTGFNDVSDRSLKENIEDIPDALDKVSNLRGRYFTWKNELQSNDKQVGFIAQEVEEVLPEIVTSAAGGTKGISYGKITALLVNAIKELKADNDSLKARIETLENN